MEGYSQKKIAESLFERVSGTEFYHCKLCPPNSKPKKKNSSGWSNLFNHVTNHEEWKEVFLKFIADVNQQCSCIFPQEIFTKNGWSG
jgi:hypothetical protein